MILTGYRIVENKWENTCFSGEGSSKTGGRWNSKGKRIVYVSQNLSLAILETLANLDSNSLLKKKFIYRAVSFPESICEKLNVSSLPEGWDNDSLHIDTEKIGNQWLSEMRSAVLIVPSAINIKENNYLLNPQHPDFTKVKIGPVEKIIFPKRLIKTYP